MSAAPFAKAAADDGGPDVRTRARWLVSLIEAAGSLSISASDRSALTMAGHLIDCAEHIARGLVESLDEMADAAELAEQQGGAA